LVNCFVYVLLICVTVGLWERWSD